MTKNINADNVGNEILEDGQVLRTSMVFMDAQQKAVAAALTRPEVGPTFVADHHRPHAATLTDAEKAAAAERQKTSDARLSAAWRSPFPITVDKVGSDVKGDREAPKVITADTSAATLDALQAENQRRYNERVENAWKSPSSHA